MVNKFLFYYISWFNKKVDILKGTDEYCYYAASALVGMTLAVSLYAVVNVVSIAIFRDNEVYGILSNVMDVLCFMMSLLSFLYYRHQGRWSNVYEEIQNSPNSQKIRFGIYCLLYVLFAYGIWFFSNDIIRVLNTGSGLSIAIKTVEMFDLTLWT
mgnify:CR=1 FL=1